MKDKFSIYSPTYQKPREHDSSITFKKSPVKFAVYEPDARTKEPPKASNYQPFSPQGLDNVRKLPS